MRGHFAAWAEGFDPRTAGQEGQEGRGPGGPGGRRGPGFGPGGPGGPGFGFGRGPGGRGGGGPRGRGRGGAPEAPDAGDAAAWFAGRLPEDWFTGAPSVQVDRDEIVVVGELPALTENFEDAAARSAAEAGRIARFREDTREQRVDIARQAAHRYGREISWGASLGETEELFTTQSVPVMTRLRQPERMVLDTLVEAGVARSRSEALAWAVRLVGEHADSWLTELRTAMEQVSALRTQGPDLS